MNCEDLALELHPYLDQELVDEARLQVEAHLAHCPACATLVERERHQLSALQQALRAAGPVAPAGLRARVFEGVRDEERRVGRARLVRMTAAAAGVVAVAALGLHEYRVWQFALYEQDAALRHARGLPLEINQPQAKAIEAWFGGKLDHRVTVPRFPNATAAGARILQVRDKPAAYIRYDAPRQMGLFVYGDDHEVPVGAEPAVGSSHGYNVVSWRDGDVVYQLVTDLDERDLRELVQPRAGDVGPRAVPVTGAVEVAPASLVR